MRRGLPVGAAQHLLDRGRLTAGQSDRLIRIDPWTCGRAEELPPFSLILSRTGIRELPRRAALDS
jgi:hypothetical protein